MAIFTDPPTQLPEYCTDDTPVIDPISGEPNLKEPNQSVKDNGDTPFGVRPKRNFANWRDHHSYKQHEWAKDSFYPETSSNHNSLQYLLSKHRGVFTENGSFKTLSDGVLNISGLGCFMDNRDTAEVVSIPFLPNGNKQCGVLWQDDLNGGGRIDGSTNADLWLSCHAVMKDYNTPTQKIEYVIDVAEANNLNTWMVANDYTWSKFVFIFPYVNGLLGGTNTPIIPPFDYFQDWVLWHEILSTQTLNYVATVNSVIETMNMVLFNLSTLQKFPPVKTMIKMNIDLRQDRSMIIYPDIYDQGIEFGPTAGNSFLEVQSTFTSQFAVQRLGADDAIFNMTNHGYKNPITYL